MVSKDLGLPTYDKCVHLEQSEGGGGVGNVGILIFQFSFLMSSPFFFSKIRKITKNRVLYFKKEVEIKQKNPEKLFEFFPIFSPKLPFSTDLPVQIECGQNHGVGYNSGGSYHCRSTESAASRTLSSAYFMNVTLPGFQFHYHSVQILLISCLNIREPEIFCHLLIYRRSKKEAYFFFSWF